MHRYERSGKRTFAEQILKQVGNTERGVERVGGVPEAEIVREDPHPHQTGKPADEDAGAYGGVRTHEATRRGTGLT